MSNRLAFKPRASHYFSIKTSDHLNNTLGLSLEGINLDGSISTPTSKSFNKSSLFMSPINTSASKVFKTARNDVPIGFSTPQAQSTAKNNIFIDSNNRTLSSNKAVVFPKRIIVKSQSPVSAETGTPKGSDFIEAFSRTNTGKKLKIRPIIRCRSATKIDKPEIQNLISSGCKSFDSRDFKENLDIANETGFDTSNSYGGLSNILEKSTDSLSKASNTLSLYITQTKPPHSRQGSCIDNFLSKDHIKESDRVYKDHLEQTFESMKLVRSLKLADVAQIKQKKIRLSKRSGYENKKTVIFDLDETLVHCCESLDSNPDVILPIKFPSGEIVKAGINIRPYCREVLRESNKEYEVIVFTASHKCYADVVLNYLDPTGELIHHRLYRDSCINSEGIFIKDLRILNRRLNDTVIVDNAAYSFAYQIDNGIPIISWYDNKNDVELHNLINYLKALARHEDIREFNRKTFKLKSFYEEYRDKFKSLDLSTSLSPKSINGKKVKAVPCRVIRKYCS